MKALVIEDHPVFAFGIQNILENNFEDVEFHHTINGKKALEKLNNISFEIMVLDVVLPHTDTHALLYEALRIQPELKTLIYSNNPEKIYAMHYISLGANGYLSKARPEKDLVMAIHAILAGQLFLSQDVVHKNVDPKTKCIDLSNPFEKLSSREFEVFNHVIKGEQLKDICEIMNIEKSTVSTLKRRLMTKLRVNNLISLMNTAIEYGYK
jgi:DNA-binding NarL/FixJ family response regulator